MTRQQLEQLKKWFYEYVATFYGNDELTNENIKLKEDHTRRMCADTLIISQEIGLNENQKIIAETISLLHDVGRFEQFIKYRTYNDVGTVNHSLLGLKILADKKILDCLDKKEKEIIETAIRYHGEKDLPAELQGEMELFSKLIRDVDKLDIYSVMISRLDGFRKNPEKAAAALGFSEKEKYSKKIVEAILSKQSISYAELNSINDMILANLGWVFFINFVPVIKEIKKRKLFDKLIEFLPDKQDIRQVANCVLNELDDRIIKE